MVNFSNLIDYLTNGLKTVVNFPYYELPETDLPIKEQIKKHTGNLTSVYS